MTADGAIATRPIANTHPSTPISTNTARKRNGKACEKMNSSMACSSIASAGARAAPAPIDTPRPARRRRPPRRARAPPHRAESRREPRRCRRTDGARKPRTTSARPRLFLARPCRIRPPRSPTLARLAVAPGSILRARRAASGRGPGPMSTSTGAGPRTLPGPGLVPRGHGASRATSRRTPRAPLAVVPSVPPRHVRQPRGSNSLPSFPVKNCQSNSRVASAAARIAASSSAVHARPRHPAAAAAATPGNRSLSPATSSAPAARTRRARGDDDGQAPKRHQRAPRRLRL